MPSRCTAARAIHRPSPCSSSGPLAARQPPAGAAPSRVIERRKSIMKRNLKVALLLVLGGAALAAPLVRLLGSQTSLQAVPGAAPPDTSPPAWPSGVNGRLTITPP